MGHTLSDRTSWGGGGGGQLLNKMGKMGLLLLDYVELTQVGQEN